MSLLHVEASGVARTSPDAVWALLADPARYRSWGPWDDSGYRDGESARGVGAVRWMRLGRTTTYEEITEFDAPRRLGYVVVGGLPVRDYQARVTLTPADEGTRVEWRATWKPTLLGRIVHRKLRTFYPSMLQDLIAAAERSGN